MELQNFDQLLAKVPRENGPRRVVLAGSTGENLVQGVFDAQKDGIAEAVLVGEREKTMAVLEKLGLSNEPYTFIESMPGENPSNAAVLAIKHGDGDILVRGDLLARDFLKPIINTANGLKTQGGTLSHVSLASMPSYPKLLALADMAVIISPDMSKKHAIIKNTVKALSRLGYEHPKLALLALIEKGTFQMQDTIEAQTLVYEHQRRPIADCELWGPISYDLIMSREAARLKNYNCPYTGEFDAIIAPELTTANTLIKSWMIHAQSEICGAVMGASVPIALTSRSATAREVYLSVALCTILEESR